MHAASFVAWTQFAAAAAVPNVSTMQTGSMQEPLDFERTRFKILSARDAVGETKKSNLRQLRTATASDIAKMMEAAPSVSKVQIQPPTVNTVANPPPVPESPAQRAQKSAGASILRMVMKKDAASEYLMQQLKGMPEPIEPKAPKCARGAALLSQLKTPCVNQGPRDAKGAALLNMIQNNTNKTPGNNKKRRNRQC